MSLITGGFPTYSEGALASAGVTETTDASQSYNSEPIQVVRPRYAYQDPLSPTRGERANIQLIGGDIEALKGKYKDAELARILEQFSTTTGGTPFQSFFLQRLDVSYSEKVDIKQLFGDAEVAYYFGRAPLIFQMSGLLFDDGTNQWFVDFCQAYLNFMRGTQLAKHQQLVRINLPSCSIVGIINGFTYSQDSGRDTDIPFSISILVKRVNYRRLPKDAKLATDFADGAKLGLGTEPTISQETINQKKNDADTVAALERGYTNAIAFSTPVEDALTEALGQLREFNSNIVKELGNVLAPIASVLGTINNITNAATSIVREAERGFSDIMNVGETLVRDFEQTKELIESSVGVIASMPETLAERLARFLQHGIIHGTSAILDADISGKGPADIAAILASREPRTIAESGTMPTNVNRDSIILSGSDTDSDEGVAVL